MEGRRTHRSSSLRRRHRSPSHSSSPARMRRSRDFQGDDYDRDRCRRRRGSPTTGRIQERRRRSRSRTGDDEFDRRESRRRMRDREAARLAIDGVRPEPVGLESDREAMRELESLCKCSSVDVLRRRPLMGLLGLTLKREYSDAADVDEEQEAVLFGGSQPPKKKPTNPRPVRLPKVLKVDSIAGLVNHGADEASTSSSCGPAAVSPRKAAEDRVAMMKARYMGLILKAEKQLQANRILKASSGGSWLYQCGSNATINASTTSATVA